MSSDARQFAPATERNRTFIADVLARVLPERGLVLEIAAGTGEHAAFFSERFGALTWQPTDPDATARASIDAWRAHGGRDNLRPAAELDTTWPAERWPVDAADALVCINMVHISPWEATLGLLAGAAALLSPGAPLYLYGPYNIDRAFTAPSNERFDASLRARDPRWGIRDVDDVERAAAEVGLSFAERVQMPANNQSLIFRRA